MSTLHTSKKTDREVLPQPHALEIVSADNLGVRTKRDTIESIQPNAQNAGMQHDRGEIVSGSPATHSVTAESESGQLVSGRKPHQITPVVPVLGSDGRALMPTHPARARKLLAAGRAAVVNHTPFVIRLKDRKSSDESTEIQPMGLGIDPGSKHTGLAVFRIHSNLDNQTGELTNVRHGVFALQINHRGHLISKNLRSRSQLRRTRRNRNLRYRAPRFKNRVRCKGWLPPSLQHRVDGIHSMARKFLKWFPITEMHQELVRFDLQKIINSEIKTIEYQQGTLHGIEIREYLLEKYQRTCVYCGAQNTPLNIDHVHPRSKGGSNRVTNLVLACAPCNQKKGNLSIDEFVKDDNKRTNIKSGLQKPLRDAAAVNITRHAVKQALESLGLPVFTASGAITKYNRYQSNLRKSHCLDALAVGNVDLIVTVPSIEFTVTHTGRGMRQRVISNKYGFARSYRPRKKLIYGYTTGDLARAVIPKGKHKGTHVGRVVVRSSGSFSIGAACSNYRYLTLLQRNNGWSWVS